MEKDSVLKSLKELNSNSHLEISCLVKTNGDISASVGDVDALELETFGIMAATIFGAASTANDRLNKEKPEEIFIKSSDGDTIIYNMLKEYLLVVRTKSKNDSGKIIDEFEKFRTKIKKYLE